MGRVSARYAGLSQAQLERIEALTVRLHEQSLARRVVVTLTGGTAIAHAGDAQPSAALQSHSEKLAGRLKVDVAFDDATTLGLVRLRLKHFTEEVEKIVLTAQS